MGSTAEGGRSVRRSPDAATTGLSLISLDDRQPFALTSELAVLRQDFDELKAQFARLQSSMLSSSHSPQIVASTSRVQIQDQRRPSLPDADDLPDSDTEDAALVLEELGAYESPSRTILD